MQGTNGFFDLQRMTDADVFGGTLARFDEPGTAAPTNVASVVTREKGDARYLQLAGGTVTGAVVMEAGSLLTTLQIRTRASDNINEISFRDAAGNLDWRWDMRAQTVEDGSFQLRHDGSAMLTLASNGALTLGGTAGTVITGPSGVVSNGEVQIRSSANPNVGFRANSGTVLGLLYLNRGAASADRGGLITFNLYDPDGTGARVVGVIPDTIARGGVNNSSTVIQTREHADQRYAQPYQVISQSPGTFSGDLNDLFEANTSATYFVLAAATNSPVALNGTLLVQTSPINPLFCTQMFVEVTGTGTNPRMWTRARSNGNWSNWALQGGGGGSAPAGSVMSFAGNGAGSIPDGWLLCNGAAVSRTTYSALFAVIGTTFGAGDGSTTFGLPDLRGEFVRGFDGGRGVDAGRAFGSAQGQDIQSHSHSFAQGANFTFVPASGTATRGYLDGGGQGPSTKQTGTAGGTETRPRNVALNYIIKV